MRVDNLSLIPEDRSLCLAGRIDDFALWYRFPLSCHVRLSSEPFVAASLLPAMLKGEPVQVAPGFPISTEFLENITELQRVFHCWNRLLRIVEVQCETAPAQPGNGHIGCFYSGGVDSSHTLIRNLQSITDMVFINGFDFMIEPEVFDRITARNAKVVNQLNKNLLPVKTNFFLFERASRLERSLSHGSCLASIALALGFDTIYVPSGLAYDQLHPLGSHPITDRLWSNGTTKIIHHGAGWRRSEKFEEIARFPAILENLRVCWFKPDQNCGKCSKCLRTMTAFRLLGVSSPAFPPLTSAKQLRSIRIDGPSALTYVRDNLKLAVARGDREIQKELERLLYRYEVREAIIKLDRAVFGSFFRRTYRLFRPVARVGFEMGFDWDSRSLPAIKNGSSEVVHNEF
jgi:hypothetical protein